MTTERDDEMQRGPVDNYQAAEASEDRDEDGILSSPDESEQKVGIGSSEDEEYGDSHEQSSARAAAQFNDNILFGNLKEKEILEHKYNFDDEDVAKFTEKIQNKYEGKIGQSQAQKQAQ